MLGESTLGNNLNWQQQSPSEYNRAIWSWHITQFWRKWWWTLNCISPIVFTEKKWVAKRRLKIVWQITTQMEWKLSTDLSTSTLQTSNHKKTQTNMQVTTLPKEWEHTACASWSDASLAAVWGNCARTFMRFCHLISQDYHQRTDSTSSVAFSSFQFDQVSHFSAPFI